MGLHSDNEHCLIQTGHSLELKGPRLLDTWGFLSFSVLKAELGLERALSGKKQTGHTTEFYMLLWISSSFEDPLPVAYQRFEQTNNR